MSDFEESEPFLTSEETQHEDDLENELQKAPIPANQHFKRSIKALSVVVSASSGLVLLVLLGLLISIQASPFTYTWPLTNATVHLGICTLFAFVFTTLNLCIQIPIAINLLIDTTLSIVTLIYATAAFLNGWPSKSWCPQRRPYPYPPYDDPGQPPAPSCIRFVIASRVLMSVAAGLSLLFGFLFIALLFLRIIALSRAKPWKRAEFLAPGEYNYQLSFTITRKAADNGGASTRGRGVQSRVTAVEAPLIET